LIGVVNAIGLHIERGEDFKPSTHSSLTGRLDTIAPDFCDTRLLRGGCCRENFKSEVWALSPRSCSFLGGTDGIRPTGLKHAIKNRDADGGFGLLTCKGPCPKLRANNPFGSTHRGFHERAAAIASLVEI
jgi:hypothetical protein